MVDVSSYVPLPSESTIAKHGNFGPLFPVRSFLFINASYSSSQRATMES